MNAPIKNDNLDERGIRMLARSMFRELQTNGYSSTQIIEFSSQMIDLVRDQLTHREVAE